MVRMCVWVMRCLSARNRELGAKQTRHVVDQVAEAGAGLRKYYAPLIISKA